MDVSLELGCFPSPYLKSLPFLHDARGEDSSEGQGEQRNSNAKRSNSVWVKFQNRNSQSRVSLDLKITQILKCSEFLYSLVWPSRYTTLLGTGPFLSQ